MSNIEISKDSKVKCQWCTGVDSAESWNTTTYNECTSREMRRAYKNIYIKSVWLKNSDHFYKCPNCGRWSRGSQLILLDNNDSIVKGLGCQPVMIVANNNKN